MVVSLKHLFQSAKADGPDSTQVQPSNWNAEHVLTMATARLLGRTTAGTGAAEEISVHSSLSLSAGVLALATNPTVGGNLTVSGTLSATTATFSGAVGVGGSPAVSTILDVQSTNKGVLLPKMTATQRDAIVTPATGLIVYNTTANQLEIYSGTAWAPVGVSLGVGGAQPFDTDLNAIAITTPVRGSMLRAGASTWEQLTPTASGQVPTFNGTDLIMQGRQIMIVCEEQNAGVAGGTFTSGAWRQRTLNYARFNGIPGASLSSNQVTLPAGTYRIFGSAPALRVNSHQARIVDLTSGFPIIVGTTEVSENAGAIVSNRSVLSSVITLSVTSVLEVQHYAQTTFATNGFGQAANISGSLETYTILEIEKLG